MDFTLNKVINIARNFLKDKDSVHGVEHAKLVASFAEILSKNQEVNKRSFLIAAWLHDIARSTKAKKETNHGKKGARMAKRLLVDLGLDKSEINEICIAISTHPSPFVQKTNLGRLLWDADKLTLFSKENEKNIINYWVSKGITKDEAIRQINKEREFYLKIFHTKTAKISPEDF